MFQNSDKIKYRRVWLDAPLEQQGPFHAIICKLIALFKNINDQSSIDKIHKLETYCTENNILLMSKFEHVKHLLTRYSCNSAANVFFTSSECKAICEEFGKVARTSKMIFISKTDNSDKDYVEQLMKHADIEFPIVIKSNRTINCSLAHSKYFVHDSDGLDGLYSDEKFMSDDLVAEELVPHSEDMLVKVHWFSDKIMFWRIDSSIPESFFASSVLVHEDVTNRLYNRHIGSTCIDSIEAATPDDRVDTKFLYKICTNLLKSIGVNILGLDFVISSKDGS